MALNQNATVASLIIKDRLEDLNFVIDKVGNAKLLTGNSLPRRPIHCPNENYVFLWEARHLTEVDCLMEPQFHSPMHTSTRSNLADKKGVRWSEDLGDLFHGIQCSICLPASIPLIIRSPVAGITFSGEDSSNIDSNARLSTRCVGLVGRSLQEKWRCWIFTP